MLAVNLGSAQMLLRIKVYLSADALFIHEAHIDAAVKPCLLLVAVVRAVEHHVAGQTRKIHETVAITVNHARRLHRVQSGHVAPFRSFERQIGIQVPLSEVVDVSV